MKQDLIIEVDENNNEIGLCPREDFYSGEHIHRGVHLMLFNLKNEVAIMKRSPNKRWYPNLYTFSVSGTVDNETTGECIIREIREEIGLDLNPKELFTFKHFDNQDKAFATLYFTISDTEIKPDPEEISAVKWVKLDWLKNDMENHSENYTHSMNEGMKTYWQKYGVNLPNEFK